MGRKVLYLTGSVTSESPKRLGYLPRWRNWEQKHMLMLSGPTAWGGTTGNKTGWREVVW